MKKVFFIFIFVLFTTMVFGEETLRYFDIQKKRYVTVKAEHIGWQESYKTISGAGTRNVKVLTYTAVTIWGQWGEYQLADSTPLPPYTDESLLIQIYHSFLENWRNHPILGSELSVGTMGSLITIHAVPAGRSVPYWFDEDGDLHIFLKVYDVP